MIAQTTYRAALLFVDDAACDLSRLAGPVTQVLSLFGCDTAELADGFDALSLTAGPVRVDLSLADGDDAEAEGPVVATLRLNLDVTQTGALPFAATDATQALIAELLHAAIETTGAPYIEWIDAATRLSSADFQRAVTPIRFQKQEAEAAEAQAEAETADPEASVEAPAAMPRRVKPKATSTTRRCGSVVDMNRYKAQVAAAKCAENWVVYGAEPIVPDFDRIGAESLQDVFRVEVALPEGWTEEDGRNASLERRVATWTMNASVTVFAPPVGVALMTYNAIRGENFRLTAQAMTLVGAFMGLGLTQAMASTFAALPF